MTGSRNQTCRSRRHALPGTLATLGLAGLLWTTGIVPFLPGSPSLPSAGAAEDDCAAIHARGSDALGEARYREAARLLEEATACRPDDVELFYWLGVARWHREQGDESIQAYERAIELDPDGVSIWSLYALENLGEVATRIDRIEESKRAYQRALERETRPEWISKIRNQLAELDLTLGIYQPDDATVFNDRGVAPRRTSASRRPRPLLGDPLRSAGSGRHRRGRGGPPPPRDPCRSEPRPGRGPLRPVGGARGAGST